MGSMKFNHYNPNSSKKVNDNTNKEKYTAVKEISIGGRKTRKHKTTKIRKRKTKKRKTKKRKTKKIKKLEDY